jgi:NodT family efflux transporter outer membrane factor (OMF) lipoprotein
MPEDWLEAQPAETPDVEADLSQWWTVFEDPILDRLVEDAYRQNLSLQIAGLRILEARAVLGIAVADLWPQQQQINGSIINNGLGSDDSWNAEIGFDAGWELDLWGKFRRGVESDLASFQASIADYDDVLVSLTSEVARTYFQLRTSEQRLRVARDNVQIQTRSLEITESQFNAGEVTELDVTQARTLLRSTEATMPGFESDVRQAKNALAILLSKLPGEIDGMLGDPAPLPTIPIEVAAGLPAELLRRRPDIRFAERSLAAQSAQIGVAQADLYPHFSLFGSVGYQTNFLDIDDLVWSVGPALSWDIFNYGRIKNRVRVQDAVFQELVANYENTVLEAVREVEDASVAFLRSQETVNYLTDAVAQARRSVELSSLQYTEGLVDYQRVLDAQRSLSEQEDNLVRTEGSVGLNLIAVYKALGGGWEIRVGQDFVPQDIKQQMQERTDWGDLLSSQATQEQPLEDPAALLQKPDW